MDLSKAHYVSNLAQVDKVLYTNEETIPVTNAVSSYDYYYPLNGMVTIDYGLVPFGIFSYDDGATWNGMTTTSRTVPTLSAQTSMAYDYGTDSAWFRVKVNATIGAGSTFPMRVKYGLIQAPNTANVAIQSEVLPAYGQKTAIDSRYSVPKIRNIVRFTGTDSAMTVEHGAPTVPDVRVYVKNIATNDMYAINGPGYGADSIKVDDTNIIFDYTSSTNEYFANIYYEE